MIHNIGAVSKSLREIVVDSGLLNDKNVNKHQSGGIYIQNAGDGAIYFCFNRPAELTDTVLLRGMGLYINAHEWGSFHVISDSTADLLWILTDGDLDMHQIEPITGAGGGGGDACCPETNNLLGTINTAIQTANTYLNDIDTNTTNSTHIVKLYDLYPSGIQTPYFSSVILDGAGALVSHTPIGYTPVGSTIIDPIWTNIGYESIPVDDTAVYTLTYPSDANHADISFIGTNAPDQPVVDYAWYQVNNAGPAPTTTSGFKYVLGGQSIDLQGVDELQAFKIICGAGMSGTINVNYKFNPNMIV